MEQLSDTPIIIVAGMEKSTRAIGKDNDLLWHVPADLKRFKSLTLGRPVLMGRKTFESILTILGTPLPGRTNIVLTRDESYSHPDPQVKTARSLAEAVALAETESPDEIHIGGGAELYEQVLPHTTRLHLTFFDDPVTGAAADTFFPDFTDQFTIAKVYPEAEHEGLTYQWVDFIRIEDIEA